MQKINNNKVEHIAIKYGLLTAAGLISFFLIMKLVGLVHNYELRFFNIFIMSAGILAAFLKFKSTSTKNFIPYMKGMGLGILTTGIAILTFGVFLAFYLILLDPAFMAEIKQIEALGRYMNPVTVIIAIVMEGGFSGVILTLTFMQIMKFSLLKAADEPRKVTGLHTAKIQ